jgi:hypothetical protein
VVDFARLGIARYVGAGEAFACVRMGRKKPEGAAGVMTDDGWDPCDEAAHPASPTMRAWMRYAVARLPVFRLRLSSNAR